MEKAAYAKCEKCIKECPVNDVMSDEHLIEVVKVLKEGKKHVVVQTAPSIRVSIGEEFGMPVGTLVKGKLATALRKCGFSKIFDTNFGADIMVMEEATELLQRINSGKNLPLITTCCPAWILYMEKVHPELIPNMSSCKSPHEMIGFLSKSYYAKNAKINPKDISVVSIMPCVAKRFESTRPELKSGVDYVLTTRELADLIKILKIDFVNLEDSEYDDILGVSTGAAAIFGATGGVMEAIFRTAYFLSTGKELDKFEINELRGSKGIKEGSILISGKKVRYAAINGLQYAEKFLKNYFEYDFIEVMACTGGCIGGGGQPLPYSDAKIKKRIQALHKHDFGMHIRTAHGNSYVKKMYTEFLGSPGNKTAKKLLHTKYFSRGKNESKFNKCYCNCAD